MITEDYRPETPQERCTVSRADLLKVADYIIAAWEKEAPGITSNVNHAALKKDVLCFMRKTGIETIADYEESLVKLHTLP